MNLVNVALDAEEAKEESGAEEAMGGGGDLPKYPYGLCLHLDDHTLEALGLTTMPEVNSWVRLEAKGIVVGVESRQTQDGEAEQYLKIQITDLGVDTTGEMEEVAAPKVRSMDEVANSLYKE